VSLRQAARVGLESGGGGERSALASLKPSIAEVPWFFAPRYFEGSLGSGNRGLFRSWRCCDYGGSIGFVGGWPLSKRIDFQAITQKSIVTVMLPS
jgi:hypothetical protein